MSSSIAFFVAGLLVANGTVLCAQGTKVWTQSRFEEFEKGTPQGVEITSDGKLRRGPSATELLTTPSTFVWAVAADAKGTVLLATGSPATVLRVPPNGMGKSDAGFQKIFESKALAVQVLCLGPDGALYAATIPDGKVYRLKPAATTSQDESSAEVVFDLGKFDADAKPKDAKKPEDKARYIWDMTFDAAGRLYIATGGPGAVYRLDVAKPGAKPEVFFKSDEQHIRALAWDRSGKDGKEGTGNLLAGTDGSGLVYRISPEGKGYVLFSAPRREITALAVGVDGTIYEADAGDKSRNPLPPLNIQNGGSSITISFVQPASVQAANASTALPDGTEIYALKPNEAPRKLWSGKDEIVYKLAMAGDGMGDNLTALTGNRGRILSIHSDGSFRDIAHIDAQQAVAMAHVPGGWLVGTANTGKLYRLMSGGEKDNDAPANAARDGNHFYASDVLDAGALARWGRIESDPGSHGYQFWTRSGNVEQPVRDAKDWGWSEWQLATNDNVQSPPGRYLQWKVTLSESGEVAGVGINYLPVNSAPAIDDVLVVPGARVVAQPQPAGQPPMITIAFPNNGQNGANANGGVVFDAVAAAATAPIQAQKDRTAVTVRWTAHDDNGDDLAYDLYLRGDGERLWRPLKQGLSEKVYSFDASSLPDGGYQIRVVASDAPSHSPGDALKGELTSERFELDTTAPVITALKAGIASLKAEAAGVRAESENCAQPPCTRRMSIPVSFDAQDATSAIAHAEYSIDMGPWMYVEPVGGLSDSKQEHYSFDVLLPERPEKAPADKVKGAESEPEHLITVRAYDRHENVATAKVLAGESAHFRNIKPPSKPEGK